MIKVREGENGEREGRKEGIKIEREGRKRGGER